MSRSAAGGAAGIARMIELVEGEIRTCLGLLGVSRWEELDGSCLHCGLSVSSGGMRSACPLLDEGPWVSG